MELSAKAIGSILIPQSINESFLKDLIQTSVKIIVTH